MTSGGHLSAGWYPDPEAASGQRWWNGSQWTSHTRSGESATSVSVGLDGQPPIAWSASDEQLATLTAAGPTGATPYSGYPTSAAPAPPAIAPGWYPDPTGIPAQRWWDGVGWTGHSAPAPGYPPAGYVYGAAGHAQQPYGGTTVVTMSPPKSVGVALLLTFFFGPFGMFYSTVSGALIMLAVSFIGGFFAGILTFGLAWLAWWPLVWVASMIWGCVAASNQPATQVVNHYR